MEKPKDCPLFLHKASGNWAKKVRGKTVYFGKDLEAALKRWADERDYLLAGRPVPQQDGKPTLAELGNLFVDTCVKRVAAGELGQRSVDDYKKTIGRLIELRGSKEKPEYWAPTDFQSIKEQLAKPVKRPQKGQGKFGPTVVVRSPATVAGDVRRIRAFLTWCYETELIALPRFGQDFSPVSQKALRRHKAKIGRRDLSATDILAILEICSPHFKPIVMLGINAAIGNLDVAEMKLTDFQQGEFVDMPRGKTGAPRRFWLWPETKAAIEAYLPYRWKTNNNRLFWTKFGQPWLRGEGDDRQDAIASAFKRARNEAGIARGTYYDLRRTFATVAGETQDIMAIRCVMGHTSQSNDMTALYTQGVSDERIQTVCEHVRKWLFG